MPLLVQRAGRRVLTRTTAIWVLVIAALTAFAMILPAGAVDVDGPDFEIDGDLDQDAVGDPPAYEDWENVIPGPSAITGLPGVHIPDPHSKADIDTNVFNSGGKFYDTTTWNIGTGNVGAAQNELTNVGLYAVPSAFSTDDDDWLVLSLERTKKQGTFALWFELNQQSWDATETSTPNRTTGDLAVGFELSGNPEDAEDFQIAVLSYVEPGDNIPETCSVAGDGTIGVGTDPCPNFAGNWYYRFLGEAGDLDGIGAGAMNLVDVDPDVVDGWDSYDAQGKIREDIGPFQFAETALNLSALGVDVSCPGFGSAHAASVASLSPTADAKDIAGPKDLPIDCSLSGTKYEDVNVDALFDAGDTGIEDWPISLYKDDGDNALDTDDTLIETVYTDANGDYTFDGLSDGVYHVQEGDAPLNGDAANWQHQAARSTDGTVLNVTTIENIAINSSSTTSTGNDFLNAQPPDLSVVKTATDDEIDAGDVAEFTITVTNDGPGGATNVTIDDHLPALTNLWAIDAANTDSDLTCVLLTDVDADWATTGTHDEGEVQHLHCTAASLAKDASLTVTVEVTTTGEDCGLIDNTAFVGAGNEPAGNVGDENSDDASIDVLCPDIIAAKDGTISYTASVSNASGTDVATADGVTLSDTLPGDLTWTVTAITDGSKCGGLAVDDTVSTISCSGIELAPGASFSVTVEADITDDSCDTSVLIGNTVTGTATNEAADDNTDNSDTAAICAKP